MFENAFASHGLCTGKLRKWRAGVAGRRRSGQEIAQSGQNPVATRSLMLGMVDFPRMARQGDPGERG
jgi:hypothetical protein